MDTFMTYFMPIISFIIACLAFYFSRQEKAEEKNLDKLKLEITQKLKSGSQTQSQLLDSFNLVEENVSKADMLGQLYLMTKDKVINMAQLDGGGWEYSLVADNVAKRKVALDSEDISTSLRAVLETQVKNSSYEVVERWDSQEFRPFRDELRVFFNPVEKQEKKEIYKKLDDNTELKRSLVFIFNYFLEINSKIENKAVMPEIILPIFADAYTSIHKEFYNWCSDNMHMDQIMKNDLTALNTKMLDYLSSKS